MKTNKRENKGKSLISLPNDFIVIDIETTGLDSKWDSIIEISAIKIKDNKIIDTFSTLINPQEKIPEFITELTGITNEMVKNSPTIDEVINDYINFIGNDIILGWNVNFDINFIYDSYYKLKNKYLTNDFVDGLRVARLYLKELKSHKLSNVCQYYDIDQDISHRSLSDCYSTLNVFNKMRDGILKEHNSIEEIYPKYIKNTNNNYNKELKDIRAQSTEFNIDSPIYNKQFVFTGTLSLYTRKEAYQLVLNNGGIANNTINKNTNYLVLGNFEYTSNIKNGEKSNKIKKAEEYMLNGLDIHIISENVFYDMLNE